MPSALSDCASTNTKSQSGSVLNEVQNDRLPLVAPRRSTVRVRRLYAWLRFCEVMYHDPVCGSNGASPVTQSAASSDANCG